MSDEERRKAGEEILETLLGGTPQRGGALPADGAVELGSVFGGGHVVVRTTQRAGRDDKILEAVYVGNMQTVCVRCGIDGIQHVTIEEYSAWHIIDDHESGPGIIEPVDDAAVDIDAHGGDTLLDAA